MAGITPQGYTYNGKVNNPFWEDTSPGKGKEYVKDLQLDTVKQGDKTNYNMQVTKADDTKDTYTIEVPDAPDLSGYATKQEVTDAETNANAYTDTAEDAIRGEIPKKYVVNFKSSQETYFEDGVIYGTDNEWGSVQKEGDATITGSLKHFTPNRAQYVDTVKNAKKVDDKQDKLTSYIKDAALEDDKLILYEQYEDRESALEVPIGGRGGGSIPVITTDERIQNSSNGYGTLNSEGYYTSITLDDATKSAIANHDFIKVALPNAFFNMSGVDNGLFGIGVVVQPQSSAAKDFGSLTTVKKTNQELYILPLTYRLLQSTYGSYTNAVNVCLMHEKDTDSWTIGFTTR